MATKKFKCTVCGYIHEGDAAPEKCPVCMAPASAFVELKDEKKKGLFSEEELLDMAAIAQSSPGAIAVNASILVGYRVAGIPGALLTVLGTILPPLIIISVISMFYAAFRDNTIVNMAMNGMLAGVAAVICDVVLTMGGSVLRQKRVLPVLVLVGSFAAARFWGVNIMVIILVCGLIGAADTCCQEKKKKEGSGT